MTRICSVLLALLLVVTGCGGSAPGSDDSTGSVTLRVLAGSELAAMEPVLADAAAETGVRVEFDYTGTLAGAEQVAAGGSGDYDAIWFSSNRYLEMLPEARGLLGTSAEIMASPVVLGLRRSVAERLGFVDGPVDWSRIAAAAGAGEFTYGMTDPSASNSGFSAVVAVATALVGSGAALTEEQATSTAPALVGFFSAQTLSAGSSGYLEQAFTRRATGVDPGPPVDGLINYESVLLAMNASGTLPEPLEIIYPTDGVVSADYPFTLLNSASDEKRDAHRRLAEYLRGPDQQRTIMDTGHFRPAVPGVALTPDFGNANLIELPFPGSLPVVDALLTSWFDKVRRPSRTIYVLDTSGSMLGDGRMTSLKEALASLSGADNSLVGQFRRYRGREEVTLLPFNSVPKTPRTFTVPVDNQQPVLDDIVAAADTMYPRGETAIYTALVAAYDLAKAQMAVDPNRFTSIVLMTDGENTAGATMDDFRRYYAADQATLGAVPVFPILFGETDADAMEQVATTTGGRSFDARGAGSLAEAFSDIRGYV